MSLLARLEEPLPVGGAKNGSLKIPQREDRWCQVTRRDSPCFRFVGCQMEVAIAPRDVTDSHIGRISESRHALFRRHAFIEMACLRWKQITCETVLSTSNGFNIHGNGMFLIESGIFYARRRCDRKSTARLSEVLAQQQDCVFAKFLEHFPLKHAHCNPFELSEQKSENFACVLSMKKFRGCDHSQPSALPKKRCRMHKERRPRGA